eukprot:gene508-19423_t
MPYLYSGAYASPYYGSYYGAYASPYYRIWSVAFSTGFPLYSSAYSPHPHYAGSVARDGYYW